DGRKNTGEIAESLGEAAAVYEALMQGLRHLLHFGLFETLLEDRETLIQGHAGSEQMAKLFGKNQQLAVRNLQLSCVHRKRWRGRDAGATGWRSGDSGAVV